MINNDRDAAIGAEFGEPRILLHALEYIDALGCVLHSVSLFQLLEQDRDLVAYELSVWIRN